MFHRMISSFCLLAALFAAPLSAGAAAPFAFADVQAKAQDLAGRFVKNFAKYETNEAGKALVKAGPKA